MKRYTPKMGVSDDKIFKGNIAHASKILRGEAFNTTIPLLVLYQRK
jgi:hypothetical protein